MAQSSISRSLPAHERVLWQGYPSWADHAVLFLFMAVAGLRAALAFRSEEWQTAALYLGTILVFFGIAAAFRYGSFYQISSGRIRIASGLGGAQMRELPFDRIGSVTVRRDLLNQWFDLGALQITSREDQKGTTSFVLKGIPDPEGLKQQIDRLAGLRAPKSSQPAPTFRS